MKFRISLATCTALAVASTLGNPPVPHETVVHELPDRRVIIERAPGVILPDPPKPVAKPSPEPANAERLAEAAARWNAYRTANPTLHVGAAIYKMIDGKTMTHVTNFRVNNGPMVSFWSSADFSLLAHRVHFDCPTTEGNVKYTMMLFPSHHDVATMVKQAARRGRTIRLPDFPTLAEGVAQWQIDESQNLEKPNADTFRAIEDLHQHYRQNLDTLRDEAAKHAAEREARRAELAANPPQPRDIHLRVSRIDPAQAAVWHEYAMDSNTGGREATREEGGVE